MLSTGVQWPQKMIPRIALCFLLALTLILSAAAATKQVDDNALHDNVKRKLANDQVVKGGALEVEVKSGAVTITGSVEFDNQKARAEKIVKKVPGVKSVVNQITVRRPGVK
jgi:hyperosmotically inducible periplasmic protein